MPILNLIVSISSVCGINQSVAQLQMPEVITQVPLLAAQMPVLDVHMPLVHHPCNHPPTSRQNNTSHDSLQLPPLPQSILADLTTIGLAHSGRNEVLEQGPQT